MPNTERQRAVFFNGREYNATYLIHFESKRCDQCNNEAPHHRVEVLEIQDVNKESLVGKGTFFDRIVDRVQFDHIESINEDHLDRMDPIVAKTVFHDACKKCGYSYDRLVMQMNIEDRHDEIVKQLDQDLEDKLQDVERDNW